MLTTLIVSRPATRGVWRRPVAGLTFSMGVHALAFYAAVMATMREEPGESAVTSDTPPIYLAPQERSSPEPPPAIRPETFRTLEAPAHIPNSIPPIDLTRPFHPGDYSGMGTERGPEQRAEGSVDLSAVFIDFMIDEPPVPLSFPRLEYPRALLEARIEGSVVLEAVIDTLGRPEPASITVINSTNRAFEAAAKDALRKAFFRAGRVQGQRVRVLVRQPLRFQLPR